MLALGRTASLGALSARPLAICHLATRTKTKTNEHKQGQQTDVCLLLRNPHKLAQNSMTPLVRAAPAAVGTGIATHSHSQQTSRRLHISSADKSRYSASTIMTSYHKELLLKYWKYLWEIREDILVHFETGNVFMTMVDFHHTLYQLLI